MTLLTTSSLGSLVAEKQGGLDEVSGGPRGWKVKGQE